MNDVKTLTFTTRRPGLFAPARRGAALRLFAAATLWASVAWTQPQLSIAASFNGQTRTAKTSELDRGGTPYLSLTDVVTQLGGACRAKAGRVQVDFAGASAWMPLNGADVNAASARFTLRYPIVEDSDETLIARADLAALFAGAFSTAMQMSSVADPAAAAPVAAPAPSSPSPAAATEEEGDLLAPLDLPPLAPATGKLPIVVIDAGHGGGDLGAETSAGAREKDITLELARATADALDKTQRFQAKLTRGKDVELAPALRASAAAQSRPDFVVSIHAGASYSAVARGIEVFYPAANTTATDANATERAERSHQAAQAIADALASATGATMRGTHAVPLQLFSAAPTPGILIEAGNLTNAEDAANLLSGEYRARFAEGLAQGLAAALSAPAPAEGSAP